MEQFYLTLTSGFCSWPFSSWFTQ